MILGVTVDDLDNLDLNLGEDFFKEKGIPGSFNRKVFVETWKRLLNSNVAALWVTVHEGKITGSLGGLLFPDPNDGELVAQEMFWYVSEQSRKSLDGVRLMLNFESWAKVMGAKRIIMAALVNSDFKIGELYLAKGYKPVETHYIKIL